jgi:hypothetical protein
LYPFTGLIVSHIRVLDTGKLKKVGELVNNRRLLNSPPAPSLEREGEKPFTPPSLLKRRGLGDEFKPVTFTNQALCCAFFSFNFISPYPVKDMGQDQFTG